MAKTDRVLVAIMNDRLDFNLLKAVGWEILRFTTLELKEKMEPYCLDVVAKNIKRFGGLEEGNVLPRQIELDTAKPKQLGLFDGL